MAQQPLRWTEALRRLPEPWPTFFEGSTLAGPTPEGVCLLLVAPQVLSLANSLAVSLKLLRAARLVHPGVTGVVMVDRNRYQPLVSGTVQLVGVRNRKGSDPVSE